MAQAIVGQSIPRIDGLPKVTGNARYIADLSLPGTLHAAVMRSPYPHALLKKIDAGEARKSARSGPRTARARISASS